MHQAAGGSEYTEAASSSAVDEVEGSNNNDWMTHHPAAALAGQVGWISQQQPLAQWIHDRQKAFAEFAHQPALFQDPFDYQLNWQGRNLPTPPSSKSYSTPKKMNSEVALSPKAKVSYDEGQFSVEIPLKDYKVSSTFILMIISDFYPPHQA